jgi:broad specificity phosphatase PhoE
VLIAMPNFILVKHSLPDISPQIPANEWHLSDEGLQRCQILAEKLSPYSPDLIYSSPEPKAIETASIVSKKLSLDIDIALDLHEHRRQTVKLMDQKVFEDSVANFFSYPNDLVFGEETAAQALERFSACIHSLIINNPAETLVFVTHGTVITLFIAEKCGLKPFPLWKKLGLPSFLVLSTPDLSIISMVEQISILT